MDFNPRTINFTGTLDRRIAARQKYRRQPVGRRASGSEQGDNVHQRSEQLCPGIQAMQHRINRIILSQRNISQHVSSSGCAAPCFLQMAKIASLASSTVVMSSSMGIPLLL